MKTKFFFLILSAALLMGCVPTASVQSSLPQQSSAAVSAVVSQADEPLTEPLLGIDLSTHNKSVDWQAVKAAGVDFVMLRIGYRGYGAAGALRADAMFASHAANAAAVGLPYGVYFYSQAVSDDEAVQEAEFVLQQLLQGYTISFPVAYDMEFLDAELEPRTLNLTKQERTAIARAFCERIAQAGYTPMIYGDARWFSEGVDAALMDEYDIWYAEYGAGEIPPDTAIVQYTNSGSLPNVQGTLDLNHCYRQFQNINQ